MEDLFPFLIFIVIALFNLAKFVIEKNAKNKPTTEPIQKKAPSSLEGFFEKLAEKLEPQPTPVPDWPAGYEQPDYLGEQKAYETMQEEQAKPNPVAETSPPPILESISAPPAKTQPVSLKAAMPPLTSGIGSLQMPPSQMKSGMAGSINYSLRNKAELRKAIIANIVFSTPRACDPSFENTSFK